ncbi:hypothetical protein RI537_04595 [Aeromonas salmonicida]
MVSSEVTGFGVRLTLICWPARWVASADIPRIHLTDNKEFCETTKL